MTRAGRDILKAAMRLPENERVQVVEQLLASLEPEASEDVVAAWASEVRRGSQEIKKGRVRPVFWEEVNYTEPFEVAEVQRGKTPTDPSKIPLLNYLRDTEPKTDLFLFSVVGHLESCEPMGGRNRDSSLRSE